MKKIIITRQEEVRVPVAYENLQGGVYVLGSFDAGGGYWGPDGSFTRHTYDFSKFDGKDYYKPLYKGDTIEIVTTQTVTL